jgi:hypothetical protein
MSWCTALHVRPASKSVTSCSCCWCTGLARGKCDLKETAIAAHVCKATGVTERSCDWSTSLPRGKCDHEETAIAAYVCDATGATNCSCGWSTGLPRSKCDQEASAGWRCGTKRVSQQGASASTRKMAWLHLSPQPAHSQDTLTVQSIDSHGHALQ